MQWLIYLMLTLLMQGGLTEVSPCICLPLALYEPCISKLQATRVRIIAGKLPLSRRSDRQTRRPGHAAGQGNFLKETHLPKFRLTHQGFADLPFINSSTERLPEP
jgi:hypothetical protein